MFKCLNKIKPSANWEDCKKILRENFSNLQSKTHAQSYLINRAQRSNETLQDYVHLFAELAKTITGMDARHNTENLYVTLFNRHLYNRHIKKHVSKKEHASLQSAFDAAYAAEAEAKKFAGLNDTVSIAKIETEADINHVQTGTSRFFTKQDGADNRQQYNQGKPKGPCYKCFEHGHLAYECPRKFSSSSANRKSSDHLNHVQLVASEQPPKVTRSVITDSQLSLLLTKMQELHVENRKMKDFVKKQFPLLQGGKQAANPDRTASSGTQGNKPSNQSPHQQIVTKTTVNKVDFDTTEDDPLVIPPGILDMLGNETESTDSIESPNPTPVEINVVLITNESMASEFKMGIGKTKKTGLFDSGATHSCMSYSCFTATIPQNSLCQTSHISVKNASGQSMGPIGICHAKIVLGPKSFTHDFIVCQHLTSSLILGLDFASKFKIGTDWTSDGCMYLHQGQKKLIQGTVSALAPKHTRLIMKTAVNLPPRMIGLVPVKVSQQDYIQPNRVYESVSDTTFE